MLAVRPSSLVPVDAGTVAASSQSENRSDTDLQVHQSYWLGRGSLLESSTRFQRSSEVHKLLEEARQETSPPFRAADLVQLVRLDLA